MALSRRYMNDSPVTLSAYTQTVNPTSAEDGQSTVSEGLAASFGRKALRA